MFKRSASLGFQYTTKIADGNNKVYSHIEKHPEDVIYEGKRIEKFECANHLQKRMDKGLRNLGAKYQGEGEISVPRGKRRKKPLDPKTPSCADWLVRLPKNVTDVMDDPEYSEYIDPTDSMESGEST